MPLSENCLSRMTDKTKKKNLREIGSLPDRTKTLQKTPLQTKI